MKADAHPLGTIFGLPQQLMAPLFQRPYVWEKGRQWEPLWEDIRGVAEALYRGNEEIKPHFLGAIVLDQQLVPQLVPVPHVSTRFIIDGQQGLAYGSCSRRRASASRTSAGGAARTWAARVSASSLAVSGSASTSGTASTASATSCARTSV